MMIHPRSVLKGPPVICIKMTHALYFALTCVARSKRRSRTSFIHEIFQRFEFEPKPEIIYHKTGHTPSQLLDKYFVDFWPYPMKNRIKGATKPRSCVLTTNTIFRDNIRRLALMYGMTTNEFLVEILTQKMANEIENDPMLLRRIPYY
jgi:hypothetical protein